MRANHSDPILMLVEDDATDQMLVSRTHRECAGDTTLLVAHTGEDAVAFLEDPAILHRVVLMLLDLKLTGMSGFDVLKKVRHNPGTSSLPIIIFTSSAESSDRTKAYELGANGYIQKPIEFSDHQGCMADIISFWMRLNIQPPLGIQ